MIRNVLKDESKNKLSFLAAKKLFLKRSDAIEK